MTRSSCVGPTPDRYYDRTRGLISSAVHDAHLLQAGCGAGSESAIRLARVGPRQMTFIDFDTVETENLTRTAFTTADLGRLKVEALADHVRAANPFVDVRPIAKSVLELPASEVESLLNGVDIILAGTDSFAAQARLNEWACRFEIPAVFVGVHEGARGGMIVWTIPGETPCHRCVARSRYDAFASGAAPLDLPGARGLGLDVAFIDAIATKLVIAILERGQPTDLGAFAALAEGRTQVVVRTHPAYRWDEVDLFDLVFADLPTEPKNYKRELQDEALFAMDSLWLRPAFDPACPDCRHLQAREASHG